MEIRNKILVHSIHQKNLIRRRILNLPPPLVNVDAAALTVKSKFIVKTGYCDKLLSISILIVYIDKCYTAMKCITVLCIHHTPHPSSIDENVLKEAKCFPIFASFH